MIGCSLELSAALTIFFLFLIFPQPLFRVCERVVTEVDRFKGAHDATQDKLTVMSHKFFCVDAIFVSVVDRKFAYLPTVWS